MIDWDKFNEFLGGYDKALITELIGMFIRDYPERISVLENNVKSKDFPALDINAHTLKSNCAMLGATEAAEHALGLEMMGKNQSVDGMDDVLTALKASLAQMVVELEAYLKEHSGQPEKL